MSARTRDVTARDVRAHYARAATGSRERCCGGAAAEADARFGLANYHDTPVALPAGAEVSSLGCGAPVGLAHLRPGEEVLDLGSGAGLDLILAARAVGPSGRVHGLDFTPQMLREAEANLRRAGVDDVRLHEGAIERVPLPDESVDVVISNCVLNLSLDKPAAIREMWRVLRPGGRVAVSDVIAEDRLDAEQRAERGSHVGCIAGALSVSEQERLLHEAGLVDVAIEPTHAVADGMHSASITARRPVPPTA